MNTIQKLNKIEKIRKMPMKFHAEFIKKSPIMSLREAVLEYSETYNMQDESEAEDTRYAMRDLVSNNLSPTFSTMFEKQVDEIDSQFDEEN